MPTATYFRLPEEKRERLVRASWAELTRAPFAEVSISRIIAAARIPRGSFYQYFADKEDLIRYLMEDMREYFILLLRQDLMETEGDLFAFPLMTYDRLVGRKGSTDPMLKLFLAVLQQNQGLDLHTVIGGPKHFLPDQLWELVDPAKLRRGSRQYADHVFHMACAALAMAVIETLCDHGAQPRESLQTRLDLLRRGGAAEGYQVNNCQYKEDAT